MKDARISGYFDTKYMTLLRLEQMLYNFEDQTFANFFNLEQVNFRVTLVEFQLKGGCWPECAPWWQLMSYNM